MATALSVPLPDPAAPDFVVVDVETACSRVSSICQIGIVGFRNGAEVFAYETLVDPCDEFSSFNTRIHGISCDHVTGKPTFAHIHATIDAHLSGRITVAHSYFDKGALAAACRVHDRSPDRDDMARQRARRQARLARIAEPSPQRADALLGVRHKHHDALSDARAAGMVIVQGDRPYRDRSRRLARTRASPRGGSAPKPAAEGPLKGERIAILGAPRDGALAQWLAQAGARVVASVGTTSTMLVIATDHPFGRFAHAAAPYRRAEELRRGGATIEIVSEDALRARIEGLAAHILPREATPLAG
jgi:DNA polymerase-3 subunit epsilon